MTSKKFLNLQWIVFAAAFIVEAICVAAAAAITPDDEEWLDCNGRDFDLDSDCTVYWQCFEGIMKKRARPSGLMWDQTRNICDWPDNIRSRPECHNKNTEYIYSPGSVIGGCQLHPHPITGWICPEPTGLFTDFASETCNSFYICNRCRPDWKHCGPNLGWHRELMTCDWWDVVRPKCRNYPRETPPPSTEAPTTTEGTTTTTTSTTPKPKITALYVQWWLHNFDDSYKRRLNGLALLSWAEATNVTEENRKNYNQAYAAFLPWMTEQRKQAKRILDALAELSEEDASSIADYGARRQLDKLVDGSSFNETLLNAEADLSSRLSAIFSKAKVPDFKNASKLLPFNPDVEQVIATSRNARELRHYWMKWREATGPRMKDLYAELINLQNSIARDAGFASAKERWTRGYEMDNIEEVADQLFETVKPLYQQLHAYVRNRLRRHYGPSLINETGPIPEHLLGDMHGRDWQNIKDLVSPFASSSDKLSALNGAMKAKNFTPFKMFLLAEDFFESLGLPSMTQEFWQNSVISRPKDGRDIECHGSAWDFHNGQDFRIKMCTRITAEDLGTVHHEMGHVVYYQAYKRLPELFRRGANPAFHEAIGDVIALSSMSENRLKKLGLLPASSSSPSSSSSQLALLKYVGGGTANITESDLSYLFTQALSTIAFLPFGLLLDKWRWEVFKGTTTPDQYNDRWWALKLKYQGVTPPKEASIRDQSDLFDPGAKYHVPNSVGYIRYFFSFILKFQFYQSMCTTAGHTGPLHRCNFFGSKAAGQKLQETMAMGASRPWRVALEAMTGDRDIKADALLEYFEPLRKFLEVENLKSGQRIGWDERR